MSKSKKDDPSLVLKAKNFIEEKGIKELFKELAALVLHKKPEDLEEFLTDVLLFRKTEDQGEPVQGLAERYLRVVPEKKTVHEKKPPVVDLKPGAISQIEAEATAAPGASALQPKATGLDPAPVLVTPSAPATLSSTQGSSVRAPSSSATASSAVATAAASEKKLSSTSAPGPSASATPASAVSAPAKAQDKHKKSATSSATATSAPTKSSAPSASSASPAVSSAYETPLSTEPVVAAPSSVPAAAEHVGLPAERKTESTVVTLPPIASPKRIIVEDKVPKEKKGTSLKVTPREDLKSGRKLGETSATSNRANIDRDADAMQGDDATAGRGPVPSTEGKKLKPLKESSATNAVAINSSGIIGPAKSLQQGRPSPVLLAAEQRARAAAAAAASSATTTPTTTTTPTASATTSTPSAAGFTADKVISSNDEEAKSASSKSIKDAPAAKKKVATKTAQEQSVGKHGDDHADSHRHNEAERPREEDPPSKQPAMVVEDVAEDASWDAAFDTALATPTKFTTTGAGIDSPGALSLRDQGPQLEEARHREVMQLALGPGAPPGSLSSSASPFPASFYQGFVFRTPAPEALPCALVQHEGGPCGVLAAVQAQLVLSSHQRAEPVAGTELDRLRVLGDALARCVWQCRPEPNSPATAITVDKEGLTRAPSFTSHASLRAFFKSNLAHYQGKRGIVSLIMSCVLTRGVETCRRDFDGPDCSLIGKHGYCTQELVNLLTTGTAVSYVHDGDVDAGGMTLRGVASQSPVGLLSLFEHYGSLTVGTHLKNPSNPIWIVCSESHYSCLYKDQSQNHTDFSAPGAIREPNRDFDDDFDKNIFPESLLITDMDKDGSIRLIWYDQLHMKEKPILFTLYKDGKGKSIGYSNHDNNDMESPIELCIRTKWGDGVTIDWNGSERLL